MDGRVSKSIEAHVQRISRAVNDKQQELRSDRHKILAVPPTQKNHQKTTNKNIKDRGTATNENKNNHNNNKGVGRR